MLRRTGFKPKAPERQQAPDRSDEFPSFVAERPRARMATGLAGSVPQPVAKDEPHYSEAWRRAVASLPCICCGREGETQCAHANHRRKGMSIKAPDTWTFPLCVECHKEFDQGKSYSKDRRRELADEWIILTVHELACRGLIGVIR